MIDNRGRGRERAERRDKSRMHVATQEGMDREEDCSCPPAAVMVIRKENQEN